MTDPDKEDFMDSEIVLRELTPIFRDVFDDSALQLSLRTSPADIAEWDSFHRITLVVAAEQRFGFKLQASEIERVSDVGSLVQLILEKTRR